MTEDLERKPASPEETPGEEKPGQERLPTVDDIKRAAEELKAKVAAAKAQQEKDIEQKLSEHETLIAERRRNEELLQTAQEALDYFTSIQKLGQLTDPADVRKLEEIKRLVNSLKEQGLEIDKKVVAIKDTPEIFARMVEAAEKEDVERIINKEIKQAHERLDPQIDALAKDIKSLSSERLSAWEQQKKQKEIIASARRRVANLFSRAKGMLEGKSDFTFKLEGIEHNQDPKKIKELLAKERESLGWFKGKEKAAIDFILSGTSAFEEYTRALELYSGLEKQSEAVKSLLAQLNEKFRAIILDSWEVQNRINELTALPYASDLSSALSSRLEHHMEDLADLKRYRDGKQIGNYDGWYQATQRDPKNDELYQTYRSATAGSPDLIYQNPRQTKEKK